MRNWLLYKRSEMGLTQSEVAEKANMNRSTYSMIELGERNASVSNAKKISKVLGFNWTIFFEDESHESCSKTSSA
ncbi:helix-turn-helix transcriptional regulator [Salibacterium halotolerans]|uniref:DNA-binding transcriptional regulator, XRE-family HTH domain n=1 Tax=Salibacterium halotolerans TaxID=1884432 RepID=A0A1I5N6P8_9BACI|nr:helix-turn-helix transcriptional regulator [Salibacterium halotolerans]SFP17390.1 DNA-binding transcriptional regulator, XRE-family HTH domain [Salibacterium halotolerans]